MLSGRYMNEGLVSADGGWSRYRRSLPLRSHTTLRLGCLLANSYAALGCRSFRRGSNCPHGNGTAAREYWRV